MLAQFVVLQTKMRNTDTINALVKDIVDLDKKHYQKIKDEIIDYLQKSTGIQSISLSYTRPIDSKTRVPEFTSEEILRAIDSTQQFLESKQDRLSIINSEYPGQCQRIIDDLRGVILQDNKKRVEILNSLATYCRWDGGNHDVMIIAPATPLFVFAFFGTVFHLRSNN